MCDVAVHVRSLQLWFNDKEKKTPHVLPLQWTSLKWSLEISCIHSNIKQLFAFCVKNCSYPSALFKECFLTLILCLFKVENMMA